MSGLKLNAFEPALTLSLALAAPPAIGDLQLTSMTVGIPQDEVTHFWDAQVASCTAVATDSAVDDDFGWVYYRIDISCSEPALPSDSNPAEPLDLGDFSIVTFFSAD